jgi:low affinity Fe/Cu permease
MTKILRDRFDLFSEWIADSLGKPLAFIIALSLVFIWAACGPFAGFSATWQLIINTGTTIATFLMVFLLQNTQNRDTQEIKEILREVRDNQRRLLTVQRQLNERITTIEYQLDKSVINLK